MNKKNLLVFLFMGILISVSIYWVAVSAEKVTSNSYGGVMLKTENINYSAASTFKPYKQSYSSNKPRTSSQLKDANTSVFSSQSDNQKMQIDQNNSVESDNSTYVYLGLRTSQKEQYKQQESYAPLTSIGAIGISRTNQNGQFIAMNANGVSSLKTASNENFNSPFINQLGVNPDGGDDGWDDDDDEGDPIGVVPVGSSWTLLIIAMLYALFLFRRR